MSNLPQQIARDQYVADGITTVYAYTFLVPSANSIVNDIAVYVTTVGNLPNPATDIQPLNTAYTVQGAGVTTGGTITFQPGFIPPISSVVTIVRNMYVGINTDFAVAQNFNGANLDLALQRLVLIMQEYFTALQYTTLTYAINAILPAPDLNLLPQLPNNYVWVGLGGKVVATELINQIPLNSLSSPFLLSGVAVTTSGTQMNYLNFATGTTGTGNLVYSNGATLQDTIFVNPTFTGMTLTSVVINSSTINQPNIYQPVIYGVTDGSNAPAGAVGEYKSAFVAQGSVSISSGVPQDIVTLPLPAGDWDVTGQLNQFTSGGSMSTLHQWLSLTSATPPSDAGYVTELAAGATAASLPVTPLRVNVTTTTNVYLSLVTGFTGTGIAGGLIQARRVR